MSFVTSRFCHAAAADRVPRTQLAGPAISRTARNVRFARLPRRAAPDDHKPDLSKVEAMQEALELFQEARNMAYLQTQHELQQAYFADLDRTASTSGPPAAESALLAFWVEQGLSNSAAERMIRDMQRSGRTYSIQQLSALVQRWMRVLPNMDVVELVFRDVDLLSADVSVAIRNMVILVEAFPGKDLFSILRRYPRLLRCEDLAERADRVVGRLTRLHPSGERKVVAAVVAENPELLFRMDYYMDDKLMLLDELPIEIQNMFVLADQGLGFLHKYYKGTLTSSPSNDTPDTWY